MIVGRVIKQPGELAPLSWDFTADLVAEETIATAELAATNLKTGAAAAGILSGSSTTTGSVVTQKVTGGASGDIYGVQCRITTNANLIYEHEIELHVVEE